MRYRYLFPCTACERVVVTLALYSSPLGCSKKRLLVYNSVFGPPLRVGERDVLSLSDQGAPMVAPDPLFWTLYEYLKILPRMVGSTVYEKLLITRSGSLSRTVTSVECMLLLSELSSKTWFL